MHTWKNLFPELISMDNLMLALDSAAKGKRDHFAVQRAYEDPAKYLGVIQQQLSDRSWFAYGHSTKEIQDGPSKKWRTIVRPNFREQVVHHALVQVLIPVFERGMYEYSCGSIPGRGPSHGKKYLERYIRNNPKKCRYVLQMDIRKFFQSIDHEALMAMLARSIKDDGILWLCREIIDGWHDEQTEKGLPIGFYTSQWFSNFYLQGLDHYIKEVLHAKCYVRYMDDMVIIGASKRELHRMRKAISDYLDAIGLELKPNWQVYRFDWAGRDGKRHGRFIDFMGFRFYRDRTVLRRRTWMKASRKARTVKKHGPTWYSAGQMLSYMGFTSQAECHDAYAKFIKPFVSKRNLRKLVSEHDKKKARGGVTEWYSSSMNRVRLASSPKRSTLKARLRRSTCAKTSQKA